MMSGRDETVIFMHIPKTAGITLRNILDRQYDRRNHHKIDGERIAASIAEFASLPAAAKREIRVLTGHMPFGLHESLPQSSHYVTFLRDPVERSISHYCFVLRQPSHYLYEQVAARKMTLSDYLLCGVAPELDNGQTRYLSNTLDLPFGHCDRRHLEVAKQNLQQHFAVVGLVERFDESLLILRRRFKWGSIYYTHRNVTVGRIRQETLTGNDLAAVETVNALDLELYDYAKTLFHQQVAAYPELPAALFWFRSLNGVYQNLWRVRSFVRPLTAKVKVALRLGLAL